MNKKLMTMLVACALSVSALSTTAVFAEDAAVTGETPAVTETTPTPTPTPAPETTPAAYEPEITLTTPKWTGDSDIVFEVDAKGGTVYHFEVYVYDANDAGYPIFVQSKVEVNQEGKGKITFTKDALKNAKIWADGDDEPQIAIDWTKYSEIEFAFDFELNGQHKYRSMFVETSVKAPEVTVTPTTPAKPSTPAKPTENKGTTTITPNASVAKDDKKTNTTTTTKKEAPKTGDTMNVALYASLLLVSALAAVVLTTKKRITE
ncbi:sortase B protein-sorting domain-containing protein [Catenibacterium sp.]|uniref:sortase B protein-sorting domain-containing protein n=1 Tax=Catenibacterium sp. TaxID=2049022 RepID=UPI003AB1639D